jgi:hypothetical protein
MSEVKNEYGSWDKEAIHELQESIRERIKEQVDSDTYEDFMDHIYPVRDMHPN